MKYSEFKRIFAKHDWANKWYKAIPIWIFLNLIVGGVLFIITSALSGYKRREKYPSDRYRKVVKEGIFFDTIEYHER